MQVAADSSQKPQRDAEIGPHDRPKSHILGRRVSWGVLATLLVLLIARAVLPIGLRWYVNRTIDRHPRYDGQIGDVDVALIRGAYNINDLELIRTEGKNRVPLLKARNVDFSVQWSALLHGSLVGEIHADAATLNFVAAPDPDAARTQLETAVDPVWLGIVKDLFPVRINRFEIVDGQIHYRDFTSDPPVDIYLSEIRLIGRNLYNVQDLETRLPASIEAEGTAQKHAPVKFSMRLDPLRAKPTYDAKLELTKFRLKELNPLLRAYGSFDIESGTLDVFAEAEVLDGRISGYIKPLGRDVHIIQTRKSDGPLNVVWQAVVSVLAEVFQNQPRDQLASVIPLEGTTDDTEFSSWEGFLSLLKNAFIRALRPGLEPDSSAPEAS